MSYALKKLEKAGKTEAQGGDQQAKRQFYYNVFLLDPSQSQKAVHKESLERLKASETTTKGWFTAVQIGKMEVLIQSRKILKPFVKQPVKA